MGALNKQQLHLLQRLEASGRHLLSIINELLNLTRHYSGTGLRLALVKRLTE